LNEEKAMEWSENKVCIFTNGSKQLEHDRLGRLRTQGEKASGQDYKGAKRDANISKKERTRDINSLLKWLLVKFLYIKFAHLIVRV
jgi:hypothetical protein